MPNPPCLDKSKTGSWLKNVENKAEIEAGAEDKAETALIKNM